MNSFQKKNDLANTIKIFYYRQTQLEVGSYIQLLLMIVVIQNFDFQANT